jgi:hypothetical protein
MGLNYAGAYLSISRCICWGYPTESAYYRDASSSDSVLAIRIPYLAIQAADDPVSLVLEQVEILWDIIDKTKDCCGEGYTLPGVQTEPAHCLPDHISRWPPRLFRARRRSMACKACMTDPI